MTYPRSQIALPGDPGFFYIVTRRAQRAFLMALTSSWFCATYRQARREAGTHSGGSSLNRSGWSRVPIFAFIVRPSSPLYSRRYDRPRSSSRSTSDLPVRLHSLKPRGGCRRLRAEPDPIRKRHATTSKARELRSAISNKVRAAPLGGRRPAPSLATFARKHPGVRQNVPGRARSSVESARRRER